MLNFDDDNGSPIQDFIPQVRDFNAGQTAQENDLTMLLLVDSNPPPGPITLDGMTQYRVDVSYAGYGRVKVWNTMAKNAEIPLGTWTTAYMLPDAGGNPRWLPAFHMEGTVPSRALNDVTINIQFEAIINGQVQLVTCKPIKASVTPILLDMSFTRAERPALRLVHSGVPTTDAMQATMMQAIVEIEARYIRAMPVPGRQAIRHGFVQFVTDLTNGLAGNAAILFENNTTIAIRILETQPGPNRALPFLDSAEGEALPFYQDPIPQPPANPVDGTTTIAMSDVPGSAFWNAMKDIDFSMAFRTHFVVMNVDAGVAAQVAYPYAYIDWDIHFRFTDWSAMTGVTSNLSTIQLGSLVRSDQISRLARSYYNEAVEMS